jgi:predicted  nucleic acid-binding Zn-ribbon protein
MAKSRLTKVAEGIGGALGRADRTAQKVSKAGVLAKKELEALAKEVDSFKKRLQKTTKRLKHALK